MKSLLLILLLLAAPAFGQDDCPAGKVRNPAVSPLDHAYMLSAFKASFVGLVGRQPSCQPGSGIEDCEYYISAADHYGVYGDDQCHAGWSGYWEEWLRSGHGDLNLIQTPAHFLPNITPPVVTPPPVVIPPPVPPDPVPDLTDRVEHLEELFAQLHLSVIAAEGRLQALEAKPVYTSCKAAIVGIRIPVACELK